MPQSQDHNYQKLTILVQYPLIYLAHYHHTNVQIVETTMPELPEVETTVQGLSPHIQGRTIEKVIIRCSRLRWPIPAEFSDATTLQTIQGIRRRGKYLLFELEKGSILIHLGMSGSLQLVSKFKPSKRHDHVDIIMDNQWVLRYNDPRRFGTILWSTGSPEQHPLLKKLGVEPLTDAFSANYLLQHTQNRRIAIKPFIMNHKVVVGVGNIYAAEALFLANIHPKMPVNKLTPSQAEHLVNAIKKVLSQAIKAGGTTLKDFVNSQGKPGYFAQQLNVYGRAGQSCSICNTTLQSCVLGQRSTVYCEQCQPFP